MNRLWLAMQQRGPLMYTVNASACRESWAEYYVSWWEMLLSSYSWVQPQQVQRTWDHFASYIRFPKFAEVYGSNSVSLENIYARRRNDGSTVDFGVEALKSKVCNDMFELTLKQNNALESRWAAYIDFGFSGVQSLPSGASRWSETVSGLMTSPARSILDAENIRLPELRQAVKSAQQNPAIGGLISPDGIIDPGSEDLDKNPSSVWAAPLAPKGPSLLSAGAILAGSLFLLRRFR